MGQEVLRLPSPSPSSSLSSSPSPSKADTRGKGSAPVLRVLVQPPAVGLVHQVVALPCVGVCPPACFASRVGQVPVTDSGARERRF